MAMVKIVTDSNSGITQAEAERLGISVIPMPFVIDGEQYFEDIDLTQAQFYEYLVKDVSVSTSQPSTASVTEVWERLLEEGCDVVHIPMSSALSESCHTAQQLAKEYGGRVQVVDNRRISISLKHSVFDALSLAERGMSAKEIARKLEASAADSSIYLTLDTLKYLKKGGRLTPAAALSADPGRQARRLQEGADLKASQAGHDGRFEERSCDPLCRLCGGRTDAHLPRAHRAGGGDQGVRSGTCRRLPQHPRELLRSAFVEHRLPRRSGRHRLLGDARPQLTF